MAKGDLINREFLKTAIHNFFNGLNHTPTEEDIQRYIEVAPPVENKGEWIPIVTRPMTDEEKEYYTDLEYPVEFMMMYDCPMPDDGQEVLITTSTGYVTTDTYYIDEGGYFENYCDEGDVKAWKPKPEPYKAEKGKDDMPTIPSAFEGMTNGEVIQAVLNPFKICIHEYSVHVYMTEKDFLKGEYQMNCDASLWNAPYQKGGE